MFLTEADFEAMPYNIPESPDSPEALNMLIPRKEEEALIKVLGSVLYNEFINGLFVDGNPATPIPEVDIEQKWKDLRDGAEYQFRMKPYRYSGVKKFLIPYVFQGWLVDNTDHLSTVGVSLATVENGTVVSPWRRISKAYNNFSKLVGDWSHRKDTLYGFLNSNESVYENWRFDCPGKIGLV